MAMSGFTEAASGLVFHELSHEWGHGAPSLPGFDDVIMWRSVKHGQHGVMAHRMKMVMHSGTHMNAPIHLIQKGVGAGEVAMERLFGLGEILDVPKGPFEVITKADLEKHTDKITAGALIVIVTGWHKKYSDSLEYFGDGPGLSVEAAEYLVSRDIGLLAVDTPQVDHPLATSLGNHRGGPLMNRLVAKYTDATGLDPAVEHPVWNGAHKALLAAGIPTIENVGGDVADIVGQSTLLHALPWNWMEGDACPVRLIAINDPNGDYRIESGEAG
jgi:kynurenine formamidase